jgi:hypothetical protein
MGMRKHYEKRCLVDAGDERKSSPVGGGCQYFMFAREGCGCGPGERKQIKIGGLVGFFVASEFSRWSTMGKQENGQQWGSSQRR